MDSDFFEGLSLGDAKEAVALGEKRVHRHRHSNSMDGSSTASFEADSAMGALEAMKKSMAPDRLAELALIDPKRAKR